MDCSLPGSSVHGILQARILEWVATPSSKGSSWPRDGTHVSYVYLHWQSGSLPLAPLGKLPNPFWLLKRSCNQMHGCSLLYLLLEAQWRVGEGGGADRALGSTLGPPGEPPPVTMKWMFPITKPRYQSKRSFDSMQGSSSCRGTQHGSNRDPSPWLSMWSASFK